MHKIRWFNASVQPPVKERLLLIIDASGRPPDANLIGKSEVVLGYWTGSVYRSFTDGAELEATHWAQIGPLLPHGVDLRRQRVLDEDVRE
jgi:hypothetical protein